MPLLLHHGSRQRGLCDRASFGWRDGALAKFSPLIVRHLALLWFFECHLNRFAQVSDLQRPGRPWRFHHERFEFGAAVYFLERNSETELPAESLALAALEFQ